MPQTIDIMEKPISKVMESEDLLGYYILHLQIINILLPIKLKPREIEFIAHFLTMPGEKFSPKNKKQVRENMGLKSAGMTNYIRELTEVGFLIEKEDGLLDINPIIVPSEGIQTYTFKNVYKHRRIN